MLICRSRALCWDSSHDAASRFTQGRSVTGVVPSKIVGTMDNIFPEVDFRDFTH